MTAFKKHLIQTKNKDLLHVVNLYADIEKYCSIDSSPQSEKMREEQAALISRLVWQIKLLLQYVLLAIVTS